MGTKFGGRDEHVNGVCGSSEQTVSAHSPQPPHLKHDQRINTWLDKLDPLSVDSVFKIIAVRVR